MGVLYYLLQGDNYLGYLFMSWYYVLGPVVLLTFVWPVVRTHLASFRIATFVTTFAYLRWPAVLFVSGYFAYRRQWWLSLLTLCTTVIIAVMAARLW